MIRIIITLVLLLTILGCATKTGDVAKYRDAEADIQSFAEEHINAEWFSIMEPVGEIVVTRSEITKARVLDGDDRSAELTVLLKGYYTPMASTDKNEKKQFKLSKKFEVNKVTYGKEAQYSVKLSELN